MVRACGDWGLLGCFWGKMAPLCKRDHNTGDKGQRFRDLRVFGKIVLLSAGRAACGSVLIAGPGWGEPERYFLVLEPCG